MFQTLFLTDINNYPPFIKKVSWWTLNNLTSVTLSLIHLIQLLFNKSTVILILNLQQCSTIKNISASIITIISNDNFLCYERYILQNYLCKVYLDFYPIITLICFCCLSDSPSILVWTWILRINMRLFLCNGLKITQHGVTQSWLSHNYAWQNIIPFNLTKH